MHASTTRNWPPLGAEAGKQPPVHFFLSHAKKDLSEDKNDPVRHVERHVAELPIHYWFDAQDIPPSSKFAEEIEAGIRDCSIVVAFLTDEYASRPWCQREILDAKRLGVPILVVDALTSGEPRSYPYLGNLPTVHWSGAAAEIESRRIVSRAVREAGRTPDCFIHELRGGSSFKSEEAARKTAVVDLQDETGIRVDSSRLRLIGEGQFTEPFSTHKGHLFAVEFTEVEIGNAKRMEEHKQSFGLAQETERTYVEVRTLRQIVQQQEVDWSTLDMLTQALLLDS